VKLLLDTHIWIWSHVEPERLGARVRRVLQDKSNELWLSPISIWELGLLIDGGRLELEGATSVSEWVERALARVPLNDAALNREVAIETRAVRLEHADPADRFLAATARVLELTLVTADDRLLAGEGFRTMRSR
jgi:PIN domain nuclease of toxin-antitoxin system